MWTGEYTGADEVLGGGEGEYTVFLGCFDSGVLR